MTIQEEDEWDPDAGTSGIDAVESQFLIAAKQVASDLGVDWKRVQHDMYDTNPDEFLYRASGEADSGIPSFDFVVTCSSHTARIGSYVREPYVRAGIQIEYEHATKFDLDEDITSMVNHPNYLIRWAGWAIHRFNLEHNAVDLNSRIGWNPIEVYGGDRCDQSLTQFGLLMRGLQASGSKVTVLRFRHVGRGFWYRSYSYAVWAESEEWPGLWIFFYNLGGLDSGGWYSQLKWVEQRIADLGTNAKVETFDINDRVLARFLLKRDMVFRCSLLLDCFDLESLYPVAPSLSESDLGSEAIETYKKAEESYWNEDYSGALRDLRAAVQDALENAARKHSMDVSDIRDPNITKLVARLAEKGKLKSTLIPWFGAFTSFANLASHGSYPTKQDLASPQIRMRVLGTFALGRQLLREIEYCITPSFDAAQLKQLNEMTEALSRPKET